MKPLSKAYSVVSATQPEQPAGYQALGMLHGGCACVFAGCGAGHPSEGWNSKNTGEKAQSVKPTL